MTVIGIDLGTSSIKILAKNKNGQEIAAKAGYRTESNAELYKNPTVWTDALKDGFRRLSENIDLKETACLCATGQTNTYLLFHKDKAQKELVICGWTNTGGKESLLYAKNSISPEFFLRHISMPHPDMVSYPIPRLMWLRQTVPDEWNAAEKILQPKDYLYYKLTGEFISDPFTWRGLSNITDGSFHDEVLDKIGIEKNQLPELVIPWTAPGCLTAEMAVQLGVPAGIPVFTGCNDFFASLLGMGVLKPNDAFDISGTSEHVGRIEDAARPDTSLIHGPYIDNFVHYGVTAGSGISLEWAQGLFPESARNTLQSTRPQAHDSYPPLFLPYLLGERAPIFDPEARGVFFGLDSSHGSDDLFYSVCEGIVFSLFHVWSELPACTPQEIRVAGGAASLEALCRLKADVFGIPFSVVRQPESSALGAAIIGAKGLGWFSSLEEAVADWTGIARVFEPDDSRQTFLQDRFGLYEKLYPALKNSFHSLKQIREGGKNR